MKLGKEYILEMSAIIHFKTVIMKSIFQNKKYKEINTENSASCCLIHRQNK